VKEWESGSLTAITAPY